MLSRPSTAPTPYKWVLPKIFLMKKLTETREARGVAHELAKTS
jgi:hypothetical protein